MDGLNKKPIGNSHLIANIVRWILPLCLIFMGSLAQENRLLSLSNGTYYYQEAARSIETIPALRKSSNLNANLPILAVTTDLLQQEEMALIEAGANGLLIKSSDEEELLENICKQLNIQLSLDPMPEATTSGDNSAEILRQEVHRLLEGAICSLRSDISLQLREHIHQILGIAGILKITLLEK
jgi:DNA-binding NarL/FixJ family response regulator